MSNPARVGMSGPLSVFAAGFLEELVRRGYRPGTAAKQLQLMAHLSRWLGAHELEPWRGRRPTELPILARRQLMGPRQMRGREVAIPTPAQVTLHRAAIDLACQLAARRVQRHAVDRRSTTPDAPPARCTRGPALSLSSGEPLPAPPRRPHSTVAVAPPARTHHRARENQPDRPAARPAELRRHQRVASASS